MNQTDSIVAAVSAQLTLDHWWPPADSTKKMGSDYLYTSDSMPIFLAKIQFRLSTANPPYYFSFDQEFSDTCLPLTAPQLMYTINTQTSYIKPS